MVRLDFPYSPVGLRESIIYGIAGEAFRVRIVHLHTYLTSISRFIAMAQNRELKVLLKSRAYGNAKCKLTFLAFPA